MTHPSFFQSRWRGLLHHITDRHEWLMGDGVAPGRCEHDDLENDPKRPWLEPGSSSHVRLREVMLSKTLVKSL